MELRYENLKHKPKAFRAFTGLDVEEFQILLHAFTVAWEKYAQQHYLPPGIRQRDYGGGRKARLATCEEKLFFILVCFKTYPLQEVLAFHFANKKLAFELPSFQDKQRTVVTQRL